MKLKKVFVCLLSVVSTYADAEPIVISDVQVSISDESAAAARDKAIAQAHRVAFHKALSQLNMNADAVGKTPADEEIMGMVKGFSPDREKQTSTSYAASFTFQFDDQALMAWANGGHAMEEFSSVPPNAEDVSFLSSGPEGDANSLPMAQGVAMQEQYLRVTTPLEGLSDIMAVEKVFSQIPEIRGAELKLLTRELAEFEVRVFGDPQRLVTSLAERGYTLDARGTQFTLTPKFRSVG